MLTSFCVHVITGIGGVIFFFPPPAAVQLLFSGK